MSINTVLQTDEGKYQPTGTPPSSFYEPENGAVIKMNALQMKTFKIEQPTYGQLKKLNAYWPETLLAALLILLYRYTAQEEICINTGLLNEAITFDGVADALKSFIPLRVFINDDQSFNDLLSQVLVTVSVANSAVQETSTNVIEKERAHHENFFIAHKEEDTALTNIQMQQHGFLKKLENIGLCFIVNENKDAFSVSIVYNNQIYPPDAVGRMAGHYSQLLQSITAAPDKKIALLNLLTDFEYQQLVYSFNETDFNAPADKNIITFFEHHAATSPDSTALMFGNETLSYKKLNEQANQLAHYLQSIGILKNSLVPICFNRGMEMIIAIIAVIKAGCAYVPIDPELPVDRITSIMEDIAPQCLITSSELMVLLDPVITNIPQLKVIDTTDAKDAIASQPKHNTNNLAAATGLAYAIYTSGSTGKPKGVLIEHKSIVNYIAYQSKKFDITSDEKILQFSNYAFDASVEQIFLALYNGATLVVIPKKLIFEEGGIEKLITEKGITHLHATPSFLSSIKPAKYKTLKRVVAGGERCTNELAESWSLYTSFYNKYGPTETTVTSVEHGVLKKFNSKGALPIGRPVGNTQVYVLDNHLLPVPIGIAGELYIGGRGVARGYLNREALTKERFIPDAFTARLGSRLYKTGDMVKWRPDGNLEYIGRKDEQVKIRGYRIELGEIENVLKDYEGIKQCVVLLKEEGNNKNLIAFAIVNEKFEKEGAFNFLKSKLPLYMVPSVIIEMDALPLTPNGKVDKQHLLQQATLKNAASSFNAPETEEEKLISALFAAVLPVKKISRHDNFFELGGHSLIAIKLMTQIEKQTSIRLPLDILFQSPTVAQLAAALQSRKQITNRCNCLVPIKTSGSKPPVYIVHGYGGHLLILNVLVKQLNPEQPVYGLQPRALYAPENKDSLNTMQEIAACYLKEVLQQNPGGPYLLAGFSLGGVIAYEMAQQLKAMGKEVKMLALFDSYLGAYYAGETFLQRKLKRTLYLVKKAAGTIEMYVTHPKRKTAFEKNKLKKKAIKIYQKLLWKMNGKKSYMQDVYLAQKKLRAAIRQYIPMPYDGRVELFRAQKRTFYFHDYHFLGWKPFVKYIRTHDIPAEHESIFLPPNDKRFAFEFQKCLDEAVQDNGNKIINASMGVLTELQ